MPNASLASHSCYRSTDRLDEYTVQFFTTLLHKARLYLHEEQDQHRRTFWLRPIIAPDEDTQRAVEDAQGESFEPGCSVLGPLDAQRESAGLTYSEGAED